MTNLLKKELSKLVPRKQLVPIPFDKNTDKTEVAICSIDGEIIITGRCTLVALAPVIVTAAISKNKLIEGTETKMKVRCAGKSIVDFSLKLIDEVNHDKVTYCVFEIASCRNYLLTDFSLVKNNLYLWLQKLSNYNPHNFNLSPGELHKLHSYYLIPKPVSIISAYYEGAYDFFPMDNIGLIADGYFLLGLRNTSPSLPKMIVAKKVCVSDIPFEKMDHAYQLGTHHKNGQIALGAAGFGFNKSIEFGLNVPDFALYVRELEVLCHKKYGSHTLLTTKIVSGFPMIKSAQLAHVPWYYKNKYEETKQANILQP